MALLGERRRKLNLSIGLPELAADKRSRFVPSSVSAATTTVITTTLSSSSSYFSANISEFDLEKIQVLGHGNSGTVYKVRHKATSELYALKFVHGNSDDPAVRHHLLQEIDIIRRTNSPYVVGCHAVFEKPLGDVSFLMEYMDCGSLETQLRTRGTLSESKIADVARDVTKGLQYLHSKKIVHRDIKPANLLMNSKMEVKIADFGVSKIVGPTMEYIACNSSVGTCAYMSPERFDPDRYGSSSGNCDGYAGDIWSLGVTLMELYMGHFPLLPAGQKPDWATLMCAVCFGELPGLPENVSHEFRSFVDCCLQRDSSKRWTASQLLTHHFLCQHPISDS